MSGWALRMVCGAVGASVTERLRSDGVGTAPGLAGGVAGIGGTDVVCPWRAALWLPGTCPAGVGADGVADVVNGSGA